MDLLTLIGVNHTFIYQFVIFAVVFTVLLQLYIKPYFNAYLARIENTEGNSEFANEANEEVSKLKEDVEARTRNANTKFTEVYGEGKKSILANFNSEVEKINNSALKVKEENRRKIEEEMTKARQEAETVIPSISGSIVDKMIGR
jgi:F0F1-type ATP synthase membrane subunit b/b'